MSIEDKRCKCSFRHKMVGDGCRYCNPQEYIDILHEQIEELEKEIHDLDNHISLYGP